MKRGIQWNTRQEWVTETCTNMDEPPKALIRTEGDRHQRAYTDSICTQFWEMQTCPLWQKVDQCLPGHGTGLERGMHCKRAQKWKYCVSLIVVVVALVCTRAETLQIVCFKSTHACIRFVNHTSVKLMF